MRTPPGFSVASLRPCVISPPCRVTSAQSPWRHAPENRSKYAARYFVPPGSFQKATGMLGNGLVQTGSPAPRRGGAPLGWNTSTAMAGAGACSSPRHTGPVGVPTWHAALIPVRAVGVPGGTGRVMLQQGSTGAMHHALGESRRARPVEDVDRMVEREPREPQARSPGRRSDPLVPQHAAGNPLERRLVSQVGNDHYALDHGDPRGDAGHAFEAVDLLAGVAIPVGTEQDARRNLTEAVHHARHAEVR